MSLKLTNLEYRHICAKKFTLKRRKILIKVAVSVEDLAPKRKVAERSGWFHSKEHMLGYLLI